VLVQSNNSRSICECLLAMGGRGQGIRRGRGDPRGSISNGRYDRVRAGSGAGAEWSNRWQVLDQTGNDVEMD
jgi:hypothetical protein